MKAHRRPLLLLLALAALVAPVAAAAAARDVLPRHAVLGAAVVAAPNGVTVQRVLPGSAAAAAGLQANDVITTFDGKPVTSVNEFLLSVRRTLPDKRVAFGIVRDGAPRTVTAVLPAAPEEHDPAVTTLYESITVDGTRRRTIVDVPAGARGRLPGVFFIGGIGCFTVDAAGNPEDGYLRVNRDMAKAGFVTMRLEKSGVGDSQGPPCFDVDFDSESRSYAVALEAFRRDPHVDPAHVYVMGHSIGTLIAPRLAVAQPVAGVIVAAAVGRNWFEYELENLRRQLVIAGNPPEYVDARMALKERCMHALLIERRPESEIEASEPACKALNGVYPVAAPYMQQVAALNVIEPWTRINVPVDAIYGTSDFVVAREDHERIVEVVNRAHPGRATFETVDALDHNLQVAPSFAAFYEQSQKGTPTTYNTAFSTAVVGWLCAHERCANRR